MSSKTTLTRELLLEKARLRYEVVTVEGWGDVGLRSVPEVQRARRNSRLFNEKGEETDNMNLRRVHDIIDQVMIDEDTPMFTDADAESLSQLDGVVLDELIGAIRVFNHGDEDPGKKDESSESSES